MKVVKGVTPSLHPENVKAIKGCDEESASYLKPVLAAFTEAYGSLSAIHEAKAEVNKNTAWTEDKKILEVAGLASKYQDRILMRFDSARTSLEAAHRAGEEALNEPVTQKSAVGAFSAEIRAHVKGLKASERLEFMLNSIKKGDDATSIAVIGAPPYLSGISDVDKLHLTRTYHKKNQPALSKRVDVMKSALILLEERTGLVFGEVQKALGANWEKVNRLRRANNATERALVLRDFDVDLYK